MGEGAGKEKERHREKNKRERETEQQADTVKLHCQWVKVFHELRINVIPSCTMLIQTKTNSENIVGT